MVSPSGSDVWLSDGEDLLLGLFKPKPKQVLSSENEEMKENSKQNDFHEYNNHVLPLIIGDTVHILEENGEGTR